VKICIAVIIIITIIIEIEIETDAGTGIEKKMKIIMAMFTNFLVVQCWQQNRIIIETNCTITDLQVYPAQQGHFEVAMSML
jgi:hypothetical protein